MSGGGEGRGGEGRGGEGRGGEGRGGEGRKVGLVYVQERDWYYEEGERKRKRKRRRDQRINLLIQPKHFKMVSVCLSVCVRWSCVSM